MQQPVICLMGPTCSGKTQLAVEIVQQLPCEIISVDSAMVYRGMNIGTAKPNADLLKLAPHRLIDIAEPSEPYSAGQFRTHALQAIEEIIALGKTPLLVGGTMLYFRVLQQGIAKLPSANPMFRAELANRAAKLGWGALHAELAILDPDAAARIHLHDSQRIQRALEVYALTGKTMSLCQAQDTEHLSKYHFYNLAITPQERQTLHTRIAMRFQQMLDEGFVAEVERLYARKDLSPDLPALRSVGYRQIWAYLAGECNYDAMREQAIVATRQLAKRQLTWLRSWPALAWLDSALPSLLIIRSLRGMLGC